VQLPGRESRLREPPLASLSDIAREVTEGLKPWLDTPFAFFGHSMGAMVAFEVARTLRRSGVPAPDWLLVSGRRGPRLPDSEAPLSHLSDTDFIAEIRRRFGGIPDQILQHPELVELLLPGLRADVAALEAYAYEPCELLDCPVTAMGGLSDPRATTDELRAWSAETTGPFEVHSFPGEHFYLRAEQRGVVDLVNRALAGLAPSGTLAWTRN